MITKVSKKLLSVVKSGYAGILNGILVDRREYPEAAPLLANSDLGVPDPRNIGKELILKGLGKNVTHKSKYYISCAEGVITSCYSEMEEDGEYGIEADSLEEAIETLYEEGWRNISYTGHRSLACPACLDYIERSGEDWVRESLKIEDVEESE